MAYETEGSKEKISGGKPTKTNFLTLQTAVDMGEYKPDYLATFSEWHTLSRHVQFQFIKQGLENRNRQLLSQWAEIVNTLDFRLKPNLSQALKNIEAQMKKLDRDREELFVKYSTE